MPVKLVGRIQFLVGSYQCGKTIMPMSTAVVWRVIGLTLFGWLCVTHALWLQRLENQYLQPVQSHAWHVMD